MTRHPPENVWDYPRPPSIEASDEDIVIELGGRVIATTNRSYRVCETSHPPTYYVPAEAFAEGVLQPVPGISVCEWKGEASYVDLVTADTRASRAGWTYPRPREQYAALRAHIAVYPGKVDRCTVDDELVTPQEGGFYGGWVTSRVIGPFKGAPGTMGW